MHTRFAHVAQSVIVRYNLLFFVSGNHYWLAIEMHNYSIF